MFEIKKLTKIYQSKKNEPSVLALSDITFNLPNKGMVFVLGKSGSGKSTLLNILGGLDSPTEGEFIVDGKSSSSFSSQDFDSYRNGYVGFVFQDFGIIDDFTVGQNVAFSLELQGKKADQDAIRITLESLDLAGYENRKPNTLSGGQKQRVAIARALIKEPRMILADEPTGSLDSESGKNVLSILKKLSQNKLVVVVSHDRESAAEFADRIIELRDGKIVKDRVIDDGLAAEETLPLSFSKSRMPARKGLRIGLSSMVHKPVRLAASLFLASIAFSLFGLASTLVLFDEATARRDVALKMHSTSARFGKNALFTLKESKYDYIEDKPTRTTKSPMAVRDMISQSELDTLNKQSKTGLDFAGVFGVRQTFPFQILNDGEYVSPVHRKLYAYSLFSGFSDCGAEYLNRNGMDLIVGGYPVSANEIAISKYHADCLSSFLEFNSKPSDFHSLLGMTLKVDFTNFGASETDCLFRITGIYDTGELDPYYVNRFEDSKDRIDADFFDSFGEYIKDSFHGLGYVSPAFYERYGEVFRETLKIYDTNQLTFDGVKFAENLSSIGENSYLSTDVLFSRFTNSEQFHFYDTEQKPMPFLEPAEKEIYVNRQYVKNEHYRGVKIELGSALRTIDLAYRNGYLPEFETYIEEQENVDSFGKAKAYVAMDDNLRFSSLYESHYLEAEMSRLLSDYSKIAFQRAYIHEIVRRMYDLNDEFGFGVSDLRSTSAFTEDLGSVVCLPRGAEMSVFQECYDYIRNSSELLEFANKVIVFANYRFGTSDAADKAYRSIQNRMWDGQASNIDPSLWETLRSGFLDSLGAYGEESLQLLDGGEMYCQKQNLVSFDDEFLVPSLNKTVNYPTTFRYKSSLGSSGTLSVKGYFEVVGGVPNTWELYFANENFMNAVGSCPRHFTFMLTETEYESTGDGRYNCVITKTSFTHGQIQELCRKGKGYEYRFENMEMATIDAFLEQFRLLYTVFLVGAFMVGAFAALLLVTFIAGSIEYKKREIGIIRCLGGRSRDIFGIFAAESLSVAILSALLSCLITVVGCHFINEFAIQTLQIDLLRFGPLNALIVLAISVVFAIAATIFPIWRRTHIAPSLAVRKE